MKPKNMPPYPRPIRIASELKARKNKLLTDMIYMEQCIVNGDFRHYKDLIKARFELKSLNTALEKGAVKVYAKNIK